jgi:TRAP-type C4-dicarboxylate transport system substrate-binding protein
MLMILMVTFAGSSQEERLDRIMKELEAEQRDAIKQQTTTIHEVIERSERSSPGAQLADSIAEHEERKILDDLLSLMLKVAEKK